MLIGHTISRADRVEDDRFIYNSWLKTLADELQIDRNDVERFRTFTRQMRPTLVALRTNKATQTFVVHATGDRDELHAWLCAEPPSILHFIYTRSCWRKRGFARALSERAGMGSSVRASHYTTYGFPRVMRLYDELEFDPTYLLAER
jgi:hypothetical protein